MHDELKERDEPHAHTMLLARAKKRNTSSDFVVQGPLSRQNHLRFLLYWHSTYWNWFASITALTHFI